MYLKCHKRKKDGKEHRYWSIVESHRLTNGRSAKRQVLYLGEINDSQRLAWCKMIDAIEGRGERPRQIALFPNDREPPADLPRKVTAIQLNLDGFELHRPRQWGACWLALKLWDLLGLAGFTATTPAAQPQGHAVVPDPASFDLCTPDRTRQRMVRAPALVSADSPR